MGEGGTDPGAPRHRGGCGVLLPGGERTRGAPCGVGAWAVGREERRGPPAPQLTAGSLQADEQAAAQRGAEDQPLGSELAPGRRESCPRPPPSRRGSRRALTALSCPPPAAREPLQLHQGHGQLRHEPRGPLRSQRPVREREPDAGAGVTAGAGGHGESAGTRDGTGTPRVRPPGGVVQGTLPHSPSSPPFPVRPRRRGCRAAWTSASSTRRSSSGILTRPR